MTDSHDSLHHVVCRGEEQELWAALLDSGRNIKKELQERDPAGRTPLCQAIFNENRSLSVILIKAELLTTLGISMENFHSSKEFDNECDLLVTDFIERKFQKNVLLPATVASTYFEREISNLSKSVPSQD